ncbi:Hypothetical predicted protein [Cloeon dipterum]|uniref:Uncharacterized protein n=1 Tax=Cloeon dipterum TaxID=197152 RepID=A0A8S1DIH5_9INSE|nr:Hypothetical predicted protein [Cloeon dipterum]
MKFTAAFLCVFLFLAAILSGAMGQRNNRIRSSQQRYRPNSQQVGISNIADGPRRNQCPRGYIRVRGQCRYYQG